MTKSAPKYIDRDELKSLWRVLERLQADVRTGVWVWNQREADALVTVMDAVKDSYSLPPLFPEK
jgi:predicted acylesterase/phospholipase RssA